MGVCRDRSCDHSPPDLSADQLRDLKRQQTQSNRDGKVLSYYGGEIVVWKYPTRSNGSGAVPIGVSSVYRGWNRPNQFDPLHCYCDKQAQMGRSNGRFYYFSCHCFNPEILDDDARDDSNRCGFKVILTDEMRIGSEGDTASQAPTSSAPSTPSGPHRTPRTRHHLPPPASASSRSASAHGPSSPASSPAVSRLVGTSSNQTRPAIHVDSRDRPLAIPPTPFDVPAPTDVSRAYPMYLNYTEEYCTAHPFVIVHSLACQAFGVKPEYFLATYEQCTGCHQWVTRRKYAIHMALFCGAEPDRPLPPSPIPRATVIGPIPYGDNAQSEEDRDPPLENPINARFPFTGLSICDSDDALGLSDEAFKTLVTFCPHCWLWVGSYLHAYHLIHHCHFRREGDPL